MLTSRMPPLPTPAVPAGEVTRLLQHLQQGDAAAFDRLLPLVYASLKEIAHRQLRRHAGPPTLCTTDLVHETYLKLVRQAPVEWAGEAHFYGVAARAMRQVLVDNARRRGAAKRGGDARLTLTSQQLTFELNATELLALDEALDRLDRLNRRLRQVVEYRFFAGMEEQQIAQLLGVSTRTVERDWTKARLFLHRELYPEAT
jgi:RNA polymerase sigma factor (TIGR02999 family)